MNVGKQMSKTTAPKIKYKFNNIASPEWAT